MRKHETRTPKSPYLLFNIIAKYLEEERILMGRAIGIDLGTTYSAVAVLDAAGGCGTK